MLARLHVSLPFWFTVLHVEEFPIFEYEIDGYTIRVFPPTRSPEPGPADPITAATLDGVPARRVDALRIEFQKDTFDRRRGGSVTDPPEYLIERVVRSFLLRFRHVARVATLRSVNAPPWHVQYLNDDGSELGQEAGLARAKHKRIFTVDSLPLHRPIWEDIRSLPPDYEPPPWEELLLDAEGDLPRIGPAVVLAAAALEVFVSRILDGLASKGNVPPELWKWVNKRSYSRQPTGDERFDGLLKFFSGRSLKSEPRLWEGFKMLQKARNSFVHGGLARIDDVPVSVEKARALVRTAEEIVATIREWIPADLQWRVFKHDVKVEATLEIKG